MIWDAFLFDDELDLLECRLTELDGVVDRFVVAEATRRLSDGAAKPLHFAENAGRFVRWAPRIVALAVDDLPARAGPFDRERCQRDAIGAVLAGAAAGDVVLFGDVDEIPRASAVAEAACSGVPRLFVMDAFYFAVNWRAGWPWLGTASCRAGDIGSVAQVREDRAGWAQLPGAGWHFSWLGGPAGIRAKLAGRAHRDEVQQIEAAVAAGLTYEQGVVWHSPSGSPSGLAAVEVDRTWPAWIAEGRCPAVWFRPGSGPPGVRCGGGGEAERQDHG